MSTIDVTNDTFTCDQEDDLAVITVLAGAKILSTTVGGKEDLMGTLKIIEEDPQIKGVAISKPLWDQVIFMTKWCQELETSFEISTATSI
jgi:hypothetical protein